MTAAVAGGDLLINYNTADDTFADIVSDGTKYTVSGNGLAPTQFTIGAGGVTGKIVVEDKAGVPDQLFTIKVGQDIVNPVQISTNIETSFVFADISTLVPGEVLIGSPAITLAADVDTAGQSGDITFLGDVLLTDNVAVTSGSGLAGGDILFEGALDGGQAIVLEAGVGGITFIGPVGSATPVAGITLGSASSVLGVSPITLDGASPFASYYGLFLDDGVDNVSFFAAGSSIRGFQGDGIYVAGDSTGTSIAGFEIFENGEDGINIWGGDLTGTRIYGNTLHSNQYEGLDFLGDTFGLVFGGDPFLGQGNVVYGNGTNGIELFSGDYAGTRIVGNQIFGANGTQSYGIFLGVTNGGVRNIDVLQNDIYDHLLSGIGIGIGDYAGSEIFFNSIYANGVHGISFTEGGAANLTISGNAIGTSVFDQSLDLGNSEAGIFVPAGNYAGSSVEFNVISFNQAGVSLAGSGGLVGGLLVGGNLVSKNDTNGIEVAFGDYLGTTIFGNQVEENGLAGLLLDATSGSVTNLTIGGDEGLGEQNEFTANMAEGIRVNPGDYAGTVIAGNVVSLNEEHGVYLAGGVNNLVVGGAGGFINSIWGNTLDGVFAAAGDYLGTTILGNAIYENQDDGIDLQPVTNLTVTGNAIGTLADRTTTAANLGHGIEVATGLYTGTLISDNLIAFNDLDGIRLEAGGAQNLAVNLNLIEANASDGIQADPGNYAGTGIDGRNQIRSNAGEGIYLAAAGGAIANLSIGGDKTAFEENWIYSNGSDGIQADAGSYDGTVVQGNLVYDNAAQGMFLNANGAGISGLLIGAGIGGGLGRGNEIFENAANGILVGTGDYSGTVIGESNQITRNDANGIELGVGGATSLLIQGNDVGTLADGVSDRGNALDGILANAGGYSGTVIAGNRIAFNTDGVLLAPALGAVTDLSVTGNEIYSNLDDGVQASAGDYSGTEITFNTIRDNAYGVYLPAAGDRIAYLEIVSNAIFSNSVDGILAEAGDFTGTAIQTNSITVNGDDGIDLAGGGVAITNLTIGGTQASGLGNAISGNGSDGIEVGAGEFFGTVIHGNEIVGNGVEGINLAAAADRITNLTIGGVRGSGVGNLISANASDGIQADAGDFFGSVIQGNDISANGAEGIFLNAAGGGLTNLLIGGGKSADVGNLIADNNSDGIQADGGTFAGTLVQGNEIIRNFDNGIFLNAAGGSLTNLRIGGPGRDFGNTIGLRNDNNAGNGNFLSGILASGGDFSGTVVTSNTIGYNGIHGVELIGARALTVGGPSVTDPNTIVRNTVAGVFATGDSTGTVVRGNLIDRNEFGVRLDEATGILIGGSRSISANTITGNKTAGVEATGLLTGSRLHGNIITGSPTGVALVNARQLAVGGEFQGEGNRINSSTQGLTAQGPSTGTLVRGNVFEGNDVGAALISATGLEIGSGDNEAVFARNLFDNNPTGVTASGLLTDTKVHGNLIQNGVTGIALDNAQELMVGGPTAKAGNSVQSQTTNGLFATGLLDGTVVSANSFSGNYVGVTLDKAENLSVVTNTMAGNTNTGMSAFGDLSGTVFSTNTLSGNRSGIVLHDRLGPGVVQNLAVTGNTVDGSQQNGLFATGDLAGTVVTGNTISNTGTAGNHASVALLNVKNLVFGQIGAGNLVIGGTGAGVYTTGDLSGTLIRSNSFNQTRAAVVLDGTRNATVGGLGPQEGNVIFGGGNIDQGQYRDGIFAVGNLAGSRVSGTNITEAWIGLSLNATQNLVADNNAIVNTQGIGFFAAGDQASTTVSALNISRTTAPPRDTSGGVVSGATGLTLGASTFSGDTTALFVFNDSTGTSILGNSFFGATSGVGLFNAVNLVFGSDTAGNVVSGGQTGMYAAGSFTGTVVSGSTFSASGSAGTGVAVVGAQDLTIRSSTIQASNVGVYAAGENRGTALFANLVDGNAYGVSLQAARNMVFGGMGVGNTISNSSRIGLSTTGDCTGSAVLDTIWAANVKNVVNKARGLTIQPTPPKP